MIAPVCRHQRTKKHGKDRKGQQRHLCLDCGVTFKQIAPRPLGDMTLDLDKAEMVIRLLMEGVSHAAISRVTGVAENTIGALLVEVGRRCKVFHEIMVNNLHVEHVEADEI